ncbi:MAG: hypothetical protein ACTHJR_01175 [Sphingomonas sp.]|uniref:hypothetical protein n=1 Tax=Sphingomonas sp. TaxID=28214 RepID=UPI003F7F5F5B
MKKTILVLAASLYATCAFAQDSGREREGAAALADANSSMLVKMTSSMSAATSKVGDAVTGELIDPRELRGARVEGTIDRADHDILSFSFHTIWIGDKSYPIQSKLVSVTSSHGKEGQDDLDQRIRIEGAGIIAYGISTKLDEGAEVRITAWKK